MFYAGKWNEWVKRFALLLILVKIGYNLHLDMLECTLASHIGTDLPEMLEYSKNKSYSYRHNTYVKV